MPDVICLGELLIDFCAVEPDVGLGGARTFAKAPGGAPANVAVGVGRLGRSAGFVGCVGSDPFGQFLRQTLQDEGVDVSGLVGDPAAATTLAFIASRSDGKKDIAFFAGADERLMPEQISPEFIRSAGCFHYGSISLRGESCRMATFKARQLAIGAGRLVTYDPNWRPALWSDSGAARKVLRDGFSGAHVAKVSQEEWNFVTGCEDFAGGAKALMDLGPELIVRSEGESGASFATAKVSGHVAPFRVKCIEPTGAGDAFMACLIVELLDHWRSGRRPGGIDLAELTRIIRRANAVGALATTKVGAIPAMPTTAEVDEFIARA